MAKTKLPKNILEESCKDQSQRSCTFGTCCICVWTVGSTCEGWYALYFQRWHLPYVADGTSASVIDRY